MTTMSKKICMNDIIKKMNKDMTHLKQLRIRL